MKTEKTVKFQSIWNYGYKRKIGIGGFDVWNRCKPFKWSICNRLLKPEMRSLPVKQGKSSSDSL
jgi:hypothetical protein